MEVAEERLSRCHGDDLAAVLPDAVEQLGEQLVALGGLLLDLPEAREVVEQELGSGDVGVDRRADALDLLLQRLAADHALVLAEVAHDVEVLEAVELGEQVATAGLVLSKLGLRDRVQAVVLAYEAGVVSPDLE